MRKKKPIPAVIDQVRITRDGKDAIIEYADPTISDTRLTIGPQIKKMTDRDIVDVFNDVMAAQAKLLADWDRTVAEIPPGRPQIEYQLGSMDTAWGGPAVHRRRWRTGRGGHHSHRRKEFSPAEFAQLLKFYAGWGMRIAFVPEELVTENPKIVMREPKKGRRR